MSSTRVVSKVVEKRVLSIPQEQLEQYREAFRMFDTNNTGSIGIDQIRRAMKKFGQDLTRQEVVEMIKDLDQDGSGTLSFEEFVTLMQKQTVEETVAVEDEVIRAFRTFDKDGNGKILIQELRFILTKLGDRMSETEVDDVFKEAGLNKDGVLNYEEFVHYWRNK